METITEVEVSNDTQITRYHTWCKVERALAIYITRRFKRAYNSSLLKVLIVYEIRMFTEKEEARKTITGQSSLSLDLYSNCYICSF